MKRGMSQLAPIARFFIPEQAISLETPVTRASGPINKRITLRIARLKAVAAQHNLISLSSPQVYGLDSVVVVHRKAPLLGLWKSKQAYTNEEDYVQYINPVVRASLDYQSMSLAEECPSFPHLYARTYRFGKIKVEYKQLGNIRKQQVLQGFMSQVMQHEIDHLWGRCILNWEVHHGQLQLDPELAEEMPRTHAIVSEYSELVKRKIRDYPQLLESVKSGYRQYRGKGQDLSQQQDLLRRIAKHMKKQHAIYQARKQLGI